MLVFLDIDGVMVPAKPWKAPEMMEDGFPMFAPKAIAALKRLLSPVTQVILSTSHRDRYSIAQWITIFQNRGLHIENLDTLGPYTFAKRKDEIQQWFNANPMPQKFVIIDDDKSLYALPAPLKDHLIVPSSTVGLTPELLHEVQA